jgi:hypothetical protein
MNTRALTCSGNVLAGEPAAQDIYALDLGPVHGGEVTEVGHVRVSLLEQEGHVRVVVGHPGQLRAHDGGYSRV